MFIFFIILLLGVPLLLLEYVVYVLGLDYEETNAKFLENLLVKPLSKLFSLFGIYTIADGQTLYYETFYDSSRLHKVHIVNSCSGIYSVIVFISALISYLIARNAKFTYFTLFQILLGTFIAYLCNILRMFVIVLVGVFEGDEALYWAHKNVGWIIFLIWISLFWQFMETNKYYNSLVKYDD